MTQTYYPFDSGQGANVTEAQWGEMAQLWLGTGVIKGQLNSLNAYADSTGMQVKVDTGKAWIQGYYYKNDAVVTLPIAVADSTNPRIDRVVIRLDTVANTITLAILQGTPAASPSVPALTQNASKWEISLAQIAVAKSATTIAAGNVTDERYFVGGSIYEASSSTITLNSGAQSDFIINYPAGLFTAPPNLTFSVFNSDIEGQYTTAAAIIANNNIQATIRIKNKGTTIQYYIIYAKASGK